MPALLRFVVMPGLTPVMGPAVPSVYCARSPRPVGLTSPAARGGKRREVGVLAGNWRADFGEDDEDDLPLPDPWASVDEEEVAPVQPVKKAKKKNKQVAPTQSYSEDDFARDWGDGEDGPPGKKGGKKNKTKDKGKRKAKDEPQFDAFASLEANESVDLE